MSIDAVVGFSAGILFVVVAAGMVAFWGRPREEVIDRIPPERDTRAKINPRTCRHEFEDGVYTTRYRRNRLFGHSCRKCRAVLWENGDITI